MKSKVESEAEEGLFMLVKEIFMRSDVYRTSEARAQTLHFVSDQRMPLPESSEQYRRLALPRWSPLP